MTDDPTRNQSTPNPDDEFSFQDEPSSGGRDWMSQLQSMIDDVATQAAPVLRQVGAKAAELAAVAGEKAGPFAHRAADATEAAGVRIAERGREVAEQLRRGERTDAESGTTTSTSTATSTPTDATSGMEPGPGATSDPDNAGAGSRPDAADAAGE